MEDISSSSWGPYAVHSTSFLLLYTSSARGRVQCVEMSGALERASEKVFEWLDVCLPVCLSVCMCVWVNAVVGECLSLEQRHRPRQNGQMINDQGEWISSARSASLNKSRRVMLPALHSVSRPFIPKKNISGSPLFRLAFPPFFCEIRR